MRSAVQKVAGLIQKVEEQEGREQVVLLAAAPHAATLLRFCSLTPRWSLSSLAPY